MNTLHSRVVGRALAVSAVALVLAGSLAGPLLLTAQRRALDDALLAAAHGAAYAPPTGAPTLLPAHAEPIATVRRYAPGDPLISSADARVVLDHERPTFLTRHGRRALLVVLEAPHREDTGEDPHEHALIVVEAPAVTAAGALLPFAGIWLVASGLALAITFAASRPWVSAALDPLDAATRGLARVRGLGSGERLHEDGPEEVRAVVRATNELLQRLDDAFHAQGRFTADAAHELRTPVAILVAELDLALRRPRSAEELTDALRRAREEAERLAALVESLLALARVDGGGAGEGRRRVALTDLVESAIKREEAGLRTAGCALTVRGDDALWVEVQPELVAAALANLLRNAAIHAPGTPVTVETSAVGEWLAVTVSDAGPGLPAAQREAVFDRFVRLDRRRPGLGLGLPLAREVARRHGGDLTLDEAPGGGLRARLTLPASSPSHARPTSA